MKRTLLSAMLLSVLAIHAPLMVDAKSPVRTAATSKSTATSLKTVFKNSIGQYPFDVKLLSKPVLKKRLIALMGSNRYNFMVKNFDVETPIEFSSWNYYTGACQAHNCGTTEFGISYNPEQDALAVRYRVDGRQQIFKEKKSVNAYWDY